MTLNGWLQILFFLLAVFLVTPVIGGYMTRVFTRQPTWLDPVLRPVERLVYRLTGVDEAHQMRWTEYAVALLLFSVVSMLVLYAMQRLQQFLPFNPQGFGPVAPDLAFNTAVSFTTNTNWQAYSGESTMSYFTQMAGLAYHNFVSAAVGISVAIAFIRGIAQKETETIGNFWVDLVRASLWVLLPIAIVGCAVPRLAGRGAEPQAVRHGHDDRGCQTGDRPGTGGVAGNHQAVRHQRRRILQREQRAPVREPDAALELPGDVRHFRHLVRSHLHARFDDRIAASRLGRLGARWRSSSSPA